MDRQQVAAAIERLYYVVWTCWTLFGIVVAGYLIFQDKRNLGQLAAWVGFFVVAPPAILFVVRGIYRGYIRYR